MIDLIAFDIRVVDDRGVWCLIFSRLANRVGGGFKRPLTPEETEILIKNGSLNNR